MNKEESAVTAAEDAKVEVIARARYAPEIQIPGARYCFAYHITIRNIGEVPFRLLSRRWRITDGNGGSREVQGEGVVGEQPRLPPGRAYTYSSCADLPTPVGSMSGAYTMRTDDGQEFEAEIPRFSLQVPQKIN